MNRMQEMTQTQKEIVRHVKDSFVPGTVSFELPDGERVRITDRKGDSMVLSHDGKGNIRDDETGQILAYSVVKTGKRDGEDLCTYMKIGGVAPRIRRKEQ